MEKNNGNKKIEELSEVHPNMVTMKSKIFKTFVYIIGMMGMMMMQGCEKEIESLLEYGAEAGATVKQVDIDVIVHIHPSSLKYFDYCIIYSDNNGMEYRDTIRDDSTNVDYWMMNFSYKELPVICRCEVVLVPRVSRDSEVSFSFINPKPCFSSRVFFETHPNTEPNGTPDIEEFEILKFDNIRIGSFLSSYGSYFYSTYRIKSEYDGIRCTSY